MGESAENASLCAEDYNLYYHIMTLDTSSAKKTIKINQRKPTLELNTSALEWISTILLNPTLDSRLPRPWFVVTSHTHAHSSIVP